MPKTKFNRDAMARWYAMQHLKTDPGVVSVYYLPRNASDREIRFVEVNTLLADRTDESLVPIDFGIDMGTDNAHRLVVVDVTPKQWERIKKQKLHLPKDWSLEDAIPFTK
jgi:hypothetical protein